MLVGHLLIPQFDLVRIARATVLQLTKRMGLRRERLRFWASPQQGVC